MALTWDITACSFTKEEREKEEKLITSSIFAMLVIGQSSVTTTNVELCQKRLAGFSLLSLAESDYDEVIRFLPRMVGLRTNMTNKTNTQWMKEMMSRLEYESKRKVSLLTGQKFTN